MKKVFIITTLTVCIVLGYIIFKDKNYEDLGMIQKKNVLIYTKDNCYFCDKAKALLDNLSLKYEEINLTDTVKRTEILKILGKKTLPQIF